MTRAAAEITVAHLFIESLSRDYDARALLIGARTSKKASVSQLIFAGIIRLFGAHGNFRAHSSPRPSHLSMSHRVIARCLLIKCDANAGEIQ